MPKAVILMEERSKSMLCDFDLKLRYLGYETNKEDLYERFEIDGALYPGSTTFRMLMDQILNTNKENGDIVFIQSAVGTKSAFIAIKEFIKCLFITAINVGDLDSAIVNKAMLDWEDQNAETQIPVPGESDESGSAGSSEMGGSDSGSEQSGSNESIDSSAEKESERGSESSVEAGR